VTSITTSRKRNSIVELSRNAISHPQMMDFSPAIPMRDSPAKTDPLNPLCEMGILSALFSHHRCTMSSPQQVDTIINAQWILPIVPRGKVYRDCSLVVDQGRIVAIHPTSDLDHTYRGRQTIDLPHHVLMPGLVNAHGHAAMSLLRGQADDLPLMTWLQQHIWPLENRWVDEAFVQDGTQLALLEMLKTGTTCFADMYFFPEVAATAAHQAGLRAQVCFPVFDFPSAWGRDADDYLHKGLELHDSYRSHERIRVGFGPHAPYTVSDAPLKRIAVLAEELQAPVHIHVHETAGEVAEALSTHGVRPLRRLLELGLLSPLTQCVHMTQVDDQDLEDLSSSGASVIHCPESNLKLASGLCPVQRLLDAGVTVGLGTDGAASNNDLDMFGELATAALVGKLAAADASALEAHTALELATLGGASALGLDSIIGSLEPGKSADVIAVDLSDSSALPLYDVASHLVYNNRRSRVTHSWVAGRLLLADGRALTLDEEEIRNHSHRWQSRIQGDSP
jgi:5-methylthioadenosine/S-adenosylhomocysteine deaminase